MPFVICEPGEVVIVPFPFSERPGTQRRPALVLSTESFNQGGHTAYAMITTQVRPPWRGDTPIQDREAAGLPRSCFVRLKLFTLDNRLVLRRAGRLSNRDQIRLKSNLREQLLDMLP